MDHAPLKRGELPPVPAGVAEKDWLKSLLALRAAGMPTVEIQRLRSVRLVNLYTWLVIVLKNDWKLIRDHEHVLIDPKFKTPKTPEEWRELLRKL